MIYILKNRETKETKALLTNDFLYLTSGQMVHLNELGWDVEAHPKYEYAHDPFGIVSFFEGLTK